MTSRIKQSWAAFLRDSAGSVTVEFALWVPVMLAILFLSADASMLFMNQSNFWNISRDTARVVSRHAMDANAAENYARERARVSSYTPDVSVRIDSLANTVTVTITAETRALVPFDVTSFALGQSMTVAVTQSLEPI